MVSANDYYFPVPWFLYLYDRAILHDSKTFDNPVEYRPKRYLKDGKLNPDVIDPDSGIWFWTPVSRFTSIISCHATYLIGGSASICPGRHFSNNSLYMIASCLLALYDITPQVDDQGNAVKLKPEFTSGLTS